MKKKIIITGGLGYIGSELCKLYSGVSWNHEIIVIDNRFISERVNQIRNWNMEFVHGDILDKDLIKKYCSDADVVHHLAGVTEVPRTKSESSEEKDKKIKSVAEEGTQNILNAINNKCKIIFPSTHVVFEGIEKVKNNISEEEAFELVFTLLPSGFNLSKDIAVEAILTLRCRDIVLDEVKPATSVTCTFRVIPSEGTKVEYLKLPLPLSCTA